MKRKTFIFIFVACILLISGTIFNPVKNSEHEIVSLGCDTPNSGKEDSGTNSLPGEIDAKYFYENIPVANWKFTRSQSDLTLDIPDITINGQSVKRTPPNFKLTKYEGSTEDCQYYHFEYARETKTFTYNFPLADAQIINSQPVCLYNPQQFILDAENINSLDGIPLSQQAYTSLLAALSQDEGGVVLLSDLCKDFQLSLPNVPAECINNPSSCNLKGYCPATTQCIIEIIPGDSVFYGVKYNKYSGSIVEDNNGQPISSDINSRAENFISSCSNDEKQQGDSESEKREQREKATYCDTFDVEDCPTPECKIEIIEIEKIGCSRSSTENRACVKNEEYNPITSTEKNFCFDETSSKYGTVLIKESEPIKEVLLLYFDGPGINYWHFLVENDKVKEATSKEIAYSFEETPYFNDHCKYYSFYYQPDLEGEKKYYGLQLEIDSCGNRKLNRDNHGDEIAPEEIENAAKSFLSTCSLNYYVPVCDDGLDNDGDGKIDYPLDPGCRADLSTTEASMHNSECMELFPGLNDASEKRIDIVFVGHGYDGIATVIEKMSYQTEAMLSLEPFKTYQEKFNFWVVGEIGNIENCEDILIFPMVEESKYLYCPLDLADKCSPPSEKRFVINVVNDKAAGIRYRSRASFPPENWMMLYDSDLNSIVYGSYLFSHEAGHTIGGLLDEYVENTFPEFFYNFPEPFPLNGPNCYSLGLVGTTKEQCLEHAPWKNQIGDGCGEPGVIDCITEPNCQYDINFDGMVDWQDEDLIYDRIHEKSLEKCDVDGKKYAVGDFNSNGDIDYEDYLILRNVVDFGFACKTPGSTDCYFEVGCYEGCNYFANGAFRPTPCDLMQSSRRTCQVSYGPVNEKVIEQRILYLTG